MIGLSDYIYNLPFEEQKNIVNNLKELRFFKFTINEDNQTIYFVILNNGCSNKLTEFDLFNQSVADLYHILDDNFHNINEKKLTESLFNDFCDEYTDLFESFFNVLPLNEKIKLLINDKFIEEIFIAETYKYVNDRIYFKLKTPTSKYMTIASYMLLFNDEFVSMVKSYLRIKLDIDESRINFKENNYYLIIE